MYATSGGSATPPPQKTSVAHNPTTMRKLKEKSVDFMVLNYANEQGAGFESSTNRVIIFSKDGGRVELAKDRKDRIADKIITKILQPSKQNKSVLS